MANTFQSGYEFTRPRSEHGGPVGPDVLREYGGCYGRGGGGGSGCGVFVFTLRSEGPYYD